MVVGRVEVRFRFPELPDEDGEDMSDGGNAKRNARVGGFQSQGIVLFSMGWWGGLLDHWREITPAVPC